MGERLVTEHHSSSALQHLTSRHSENMVCGKTAAMLAAFALVVTSSHAHPGTDATADKAGVRFPPNDLQGSAKTPKDAQGQVKDNEASGASARFGFLTNSIYPGTYSTGNGGGYAAASPLKLDLGGLLVGGAIGLGLIFLVPKLFAPIGGYGCYNARSVDEQESGATQFLARLDKTLASHNIDSASCAQRALCSYIQSSALKVKNGSASTFDSVLADISSKASAENIFGSSDYQRALDTGRSGGDCATTFPLCPSDSSQLMGALKSFVVSSLM